MLTTKLCCVCMTTPRGWGGVRVGVVDQPASLSKFDCLAFRDWLVGLQGGLFKNKNTILSV